MRTLIKVIKEHLDLIMGTLIGVVSAFLVKWELAMVQLISSVIILILVLTGLFKVGFTYKAPKINKNKAQKEDALNKIVESQKPMKAIKIAQNPTQMGEELGEAIIETMKGSKKMIKWIKNNKGAIVSWLVAILGLLELIFNWLGDLLPTEIGFNIVGVVITVVGFVVATLTSGFGSTQFKEALAQLKDQLNGDKTDLDEINSIKYLERQILAYNKAISSTEKEIDSLNKEYANVIEDVKTCRHLGVNLDEETNTKYEEYNAKLKPLTEKLNSKQGALQTYKNKLEQVKLYIENKVQ